MRMMIFDGHNDTLTQIRKVIGINFHVGFRRGDGDQEASTSLEEVVRHIRYVADRAGFVEVELRGICARNRLRVSRATWGA